MCEYCNKRERETRIPRDLHNFKRATVCISDRNPSLFLDAEDGRAFVLMIEYCPMCGRKLKDK